MRIIWHEDAWAGYLYWQTQDRRRLRRINSLIRDIDRNGCDGIGKPEPLRGDSAGWWSHRIDEGNRIIYRIRDGAIEIAQCGGHCGDS